MTKKLMVGKVAVGGGAPVSIQSMCNTPTQDVESTVGQILRLTEGSLAPVTCLEGDENTCPRAGHCTTLPMWEKLDAIINDYLDSVSLADLLTQTDGGAL